MSELITSCAICRRIRIIQGEDVSGIDKDANFSDTYCPDCIQEQFETDGKYNNYDHRDFDSYAEAEKEMKSEVGQDREKERKLNQVWVELTQKEKEVAKEGRELKRS